MKTEDQFVKELNEVELGDWKYLNDFRTQLADMAIKYKGTPHHFPNEGDYPWLDFMEDSNLIQEYYNLLTPGSNLYG